MFDNQYAGMQFTLYTVYNHMLLHDAHEAGLLPDDFWKDYLTKMIGATRKLLNETTAIMEGDDDEKAD